MSFSLCWLCLLVGTASVPEVVSAVHDLQLEGQLSDSERGKDARQIMEKRAEVLKLGGGESKEGRAWGGFDLRDFLRDFR